MKEMSSAVTKLVLLEERNTQTVRLIERAMKELDDQKVEEICATVSKSTPFILCSNKK